MQLEDDNMKLDIDFTKIPKKLKVDVKKGASGALIAELPTFGIFTEANDLNELFLNVNDLIYTYYDIPKKYQDEISFIPNNAAREELLQIVGQSSSDFKHVNVKTYYTPDLCKRIMSA